jgi:hypothetical protein
VRSAGVLFSDCVAGLSGAPGKRSGPFCPQAVNANISMTAANAVTILVSCLRMALSCVVCGYFFYRFLTLQILSSF